MVLQQNFALHYYRTHLERDIINSTGKDKYKEAYSTEGGEDGSGTDFDVFRED